jgi:hypothetical protein
MGPALVNSGARGGVLEAVMAFSGAAKLPVTRARERRVMMVFIISSNFSTQI